MKKLVLVLTAILMVLLLFSGCGNKVASDDEIIKVYKDLDTLDFQAQADLGDAAKSEAALKNIYVEPQLTQAQKYLADMRANDVKLIRYKTNYKTLEILKKDAAEISLHVEAVTTGDYFTIKYPNTKLGPLVNNSSYDVTLKKVNNKWLIAEIRPVETKEENKK